MGIMEMQPELPGLSVAAAEPSSPVAARSTAPAESTPEPPRHHLPAALRNTLEQIPDRRIASPNSPQIGDMPTFENPTPACRGADLDAFYPDDARPQPDPELRRMCGRCDHQTTCMIWALNNEEFGLWGLTATERAALGGRSERVFGRSATSAAEAAVRAGIDPENLNTALQVVHAGRLVVAVPEDSRGLVARAS